MMQFQILGPLRVTSGDQREIALGGAKPAAVLAMLLLRPNELIAADQLIEDLWDGRPPATAAKTLQVHVSRLRRALGEGQNGDTRGAVVTAGSGYRFDVESDQVDALRFEGLVAEGGAALADGAHVRASARLRAALGLWHGEALADFRYASFAQDSIARLDGLRTVALESAVAAELALGRHVELVPELKALVKRHPLSEHLRAQLMLALYRAGRQAEALGVYRAGRRILVDQLGIEPSEELRDLERRILAQDPDLAAPVPQRREHAERSERSQRGTFVGYERELGALEDVLEQALAGQGRLALIAGEPGVGKTRLADELASVAHARGAQVVWGRCWNGGGAPAYWPWIQVLRELVANRDPLALRADLGASAGELAQLVPELRDLLGVESPDHSDEADARFLLFDAATGFVTRAAAARPLLIVLDDLHVADESTMSLLQLMAGAVFAAPVLIAATYRDTEADLGRPLSEGLSQLVRTSDCLQLVLTGIATADTAHFVELSAGIAPMPALAAAIHDTSAGNPLFVSELVRMLQAEDRLQELDATDGLELPRGVDQVIARRLEHLSEPCRRTLSLAAVIGRDFGLTALERAADAPSDELLDHIDDAIAARVVEADKQRRGTFRFSHDLVRHSLYSGLGEAERRRMHGAVALALEQLQAPRPEEAAADLAHHFSEALPTAESAKAMRYLTLAGDAAAEVCAWAEAASYYSRAAEIGQAYSVDHGELCELYLSLAEQYVYITDLQPAKAAIEKAEALAVTGDPARDGRLAVARAHLGLLDTDALDEGRVLDAITLFQEIDNPAAEARAWWAVVTINCGYSARIQEGEAAQRMLECAKRAGSSGLVSQALRGIAASLAMGSTPVSEATARVQALIAEARDPVVRARLLVPRAVLAAASGHFDEARALMAESTAITPPAETKALRCTCLSYAARIELLAGNVLRAEELARELCDYYWAEGMVAYLSSELMFLVDALIAQGRLDDAAVELGRAEPLAAPDDIDAHFRQARSRARLELARGDLDAAEQSARQAVTRVLEVEAPDEHAETLLVLARALLAAGKEAEGRAAAEEALEIVVARENVPLGQQARELLTPSKPLQVFPPTVRAEAQA